MRWMVMPLWRCLDFAGRSRRREFWLFFLLPLIVWLALLYWLFRTLVAIGAAGDTGHAIDDFAGPFGTSLGVLAVLGLVLLLPTIAVQVRRFHDQDRSGLLVLLNLIPTVGNIVVLVMMCLPGTPGANRYGPDPRT